MARIDVEEKNRRSPNKNYKWWIIAIIVILVVIIAWIAFSDRNRAHVDVPPEPVVLKDRTGTNHLM
jgi:cbb3-type cytochrome oxidase subunit 3